VKATGVEAEPASDRGADLIGIEVLAFDLAALHNVPARTDDARRATTDHAIRRS
jgi:hypothetical protein